MIRRRIVDRLKNDFPVSAAETGRQDQCQHLEVGLASVSGDATFLRNLPDKIRNSIEAHLEGDTLEMTWDVAPWP